ncbi:MAG: tetratricopeptide repeat protein [Leptospirillia bacterium]
MKRDWLFRTLLVLATATFTWGTPPALADNPIPNGVETGPGANYFVRGVALVSSGHPEQGFPLMAASVAMAPDNMHRNTYLTLFLDLPAHNRNTPVLEAVHRTAPNFVPAMGQLARLYEGNLRYAEAEALLTRWAELRPEMAEPQARLGELYYFTGHYDQAIQAFSLHRELIGESPYALRRMAASHLELGNTRAANQLLDKVRVLDGLQPNGVSITMNQSR